MSWMLLIVAGLFEVGWAIGLKHSDGFSRPAPSVLTAVCLGLSMVLLALALRSLPVGTAYGVWVGIGAIGTATLGIVLFGEPAHPARLLFLGLLVVAIAGLKVTAGGD